MAGAAPFPYCSCLRTAPASVLRLPQAQTLYSIVADPLYHQLECLPVQAVGPGAISVIRRPSGKNERGEAAFTKSGGIIHGSDHHSIIIHR